MLAERLLAKPSFENENEIRTLEHLKMRFGESNLHNCEVGCHDVSFLVVEGLCCTGGRDVSGVPAASRLRDHETLSLCR